MCKVAAGPRWGARGLALVAALVSLAGPATARGAIGDIIVVDPDPFGDGRVIRVEPSTGVRATLSANAEPAGGPSFVDPVGVAITTSGILVTDANAFDGGGAVIRVDPVTGIRSTVSDNATALGGPTLVDPWGIAHDANGDILIADRDAFGGGGGIMRIDPLTGRRTTVSENSSPAGGPSFVHPVALAVASNGDILVADQEAFDGLGGVISVDPRTGVRTTVSANLDPVGEPSFDTPVGIALARNGDILVANFNDGGVIRVDPLTGQRSTVSDATHPPGEPSFFPAGITLAGNGDILVTDFAAFVEGHGGVVRIDPQSGHRDVVSSNTAPVGAPNFVTPTGIALERCQLVRVVVQLQTKTIKVCI